MPISILRARTSFAVALAISLVMLMGTSRSYGGTLSLGSAGGYALVALGSGDTIGMNSGPLTGSVLLGNGITAAFAGGGGGQITGTLFYDNTVLNTNTFTHLATPPTTSLVSTSITAMALADAQAASNYASSLSATQSFGTISGTSTITGNGGLNVINVGNINNATLTLSGSANDFFVFNVSGGVNTNRLMNLDGGVDASRILFNLTGTSGNVFQTSGGNSLYGTFLATRGGNFQFSNLDLDGALINTAGDVQFVSGTGIRTCTPLDDIVTIQAVPEPTTMGLALAGTLLFGSAGLWRKHRRGTDAHA